MTIRTERAGTGKRIPSLDGLRAISIGLVLIGHLAGTRGFPISDHGRLFLELAPLGVRTFFVISGFLITTLLMQEVAARSKISLQAFYYRRLLRIFPACYAYVTVMAVAAAAGWVAIKGPDLVRAYSYTMNYYSDRGWYLGHLWSLSVEEQFYLLWPGVLVVLGLRRGLWAAAAVIVLAPMARVGTVLFLPSQRTMIGESFQTVADALATGCLLAGVWERLNGRAGYLKFLNSRFFGVVPAVFVAAHLCSRYPKFGYPVGETLLNITIVLMINRWVRFPGDIFGRFLNLRPMVFIGVLSYSLYLWQQPFLDRHNPRLITAFPVNLLLAFAAALLSYYVVEKPLLGLRDRLRNKRLAQPEVSRAERVDAMRPA